MVKFLFSGQQGPVQHVLLQSPKPGSVGSGSGATVLQPSQLSQQPQSTPPTIAPKPSPVQSKPTSSPSQSQNAMYTQGIFVDGKLYSSRSEGYWVNIFISSQKHMLCVLDWWEHLMKSYGTIWRLFLARWLILLLAYKTHFFFLHIGNMKYF